MTDSEITTKVQRDLGKMLTERKPHGSTRPIHAGVEVPKTLSGLY